MKKPKPRMIRATLRRRDGSYVRRLPLCDNDDFMYCLLTSRYYDRQRGCTYVERFWPHHKQHIKELRASESDDPLDVARAASGLPIFVCGGYL